MKQFTHRIQVATRGKGLYPITTEIADWTKQQGLRTGLEPELFRLRRGVSDSEREK